MTEVTYKSLIWSEEQLVKFYNIFCSDPSPCHTDFFCLAARKKYMTETQRKNINLGDTCMMQKTILKDYDVRKFISKVRQADAAASFFTDKDGNYIPRSCYTFYMNLNKTNVLKATKDFKDQLNVWDYDLATTILFNNATKKENIGKQIKTIQNSLLKSFQDPKNTEGPWLDIDCDIGVVSEELVQKYKEKLVDFFAGTDVYVLRTHGGIHIVFSKELISSYNKSMATVFSKKEMKDHILTLDKILSFVREMILEDFSEEDVTEIKLNQNVAVPLPGTLVNNVKIMIV